MKNGRVSIAGDQITLTGSTTAVQLQDQGYLDLSSRSESSTALVQINGNVEAASGGTVSLKNADVNLSAGSKFNVETLSGDNSSIMVNKLLDEGSTVAVASNQSRNLRIRASSDINDSYADPAAAAAALAKSIDVENVNDGSYTLSGESGALSDAWTADKEGHVTSHTTNQSMETVSNFNVRARA